MLKLDVVYELEAFRICDRGTYIHGKKKTIFYLLGFLIGLFMSLSLLLFSSEKLHKRKLIFSCIATSQTKRIANNKRTL